MAYPSTWTGSTELSDESGTAEFKIEGIEFYLQLKCFTDYQEVSQMLDLAFDQGKRFAANALRSHINRALDDATTAHAL